MDALVSLPVRLELFFRVTAMVLMLSAIISSVSAWAERELNISLRRCAPPGRRGLFDDGDLHGQQLTAQFDLNVEDAGFRTLGGVQGEDGFAGRRDDGFVQFGLHAG